MSNNANGTYPINVPMSDKDLVRMLNAIYEAAMVDECLYFPDVLKISSVQNYSGNNNLICFEFYCYDLRDRLKILCLTFDKLTRSLSWEGNVLKKFVEPYKNFQNVAEGSVIPLIIAMSKYGIQEAEMSLCGPMLFVKKQITVSTLKGSRKFFTLVSKSETVDYYIEKSVSDKWDRYKSDFNDYYGQKSSDVSQESDKSKPLDVNMFDEDSVNIAEVERFEEANPDVIKEINSWNIGTEN